MLYNSIIITEEDRRGNLPNKILIPYFAKAEKWGLPASKIRDKSHHLAFAGSTSVVDRYCPSCNKGIKPAELRQAIIEQMQVEEASEGGESHKFVDFGKGQGNRMRQSVDAADDVVAAIQAGIFCPIPRGDTNATKRLFCAILSLCIPIIFSDVLMLPFEKSGAAWRDFTIRIPENKIFEEDILISTIAVILDQEKKGIKKANVPSLSMLQKKLVEHRQRFVWTLDANHSAGTGDAFYHVGKELQMYAFDWNGRGEYV